MKEKTGEAKNASAKYLQDEETVREKWFLHLNA